MLLAGALCYREAWTPPTSHADDAVRIENKVKKVIPMKYNRIVASIARSLVLSHFFCEMYALWATSEAPPLNLKRSGVNNICPLSGPSTSSSILQNIYPSSSISWQATLGLCLVMFGGLTRASCHRALGKMFTWETSIQKDHKLITSGAYRFVRHPSYTGMLAVSTGYLVLMLSPGTFARECFIGPTSSVGIIQSTVRASSLVYVTLVALYFTDVCSWLVRRSFVEDDMMKGTFGKEWEEWARNVRWRVVPYVL